MGILLGITIGIIFSLFIWILPSNDKIKKLKRTVNYFDSTYLQKQGGTSTYGNGELGKDFINYDLRSWDGGKNWYATKYNFDTKELKILGEAESIYPNLLKHLDALDKLSDYAFKNGGIKCSNDTAGINLLKDAGFTITKNK